MNNKYCLALKFMHPPHPSAMQERHTCETKPSLTADMISSGHQDVHKVDPEKMARSSRSIYNAIEIARSDQRQGLAQEKLKAAAIEVASSKRSKAAADVKAKRPVGEKKANALKPPSKAIKTAKPPPKKRNKRRSTSW
ncbi:hypothetical protein HHI36_020546 [Cryptolaemus montrouzieri]|uniref:Uncharacterized protein n=1 Tax=Cryptolaemus montrouzieri TaxID=559131 RepID=A0ABD2NB82_9CUCU